MSMGIYLHNMDMPKGTNMMLLISPDGDVWEMGDLIGDDKHLDGVKAVPVPPHGRLKKRLVYRGEVYNALEAERVKSLDGILTDPYKDGFHDGLKRALQILANEVDDAPTIIEAEEGE